MAHITIDGLGLDWNDQVLEPRPWTAMQARWAAELSATLPDGPLLELCCGAGAIGLLAVRDTGRQGVLVDSDATACELAECNARRAGLHTRTRVVRHRVDGAPVPDVPGALHLVLADPPYVASPDTEDADPAHAVDGGEDGLELMPAVLATASAHLASGGLCLLQVRGPAQARVVCEHLAGDWSRVGLQPGEIRSHDDDRAVLVLMRSGRDG